MVQIRFSVLLIERISLGKPHYGKADCDSELVRLSMATYRSGASTSSTEHSRVLLGLVRYMYLFITNKPPAWTKLVRF
jgi:hypothetical protein